MTLYIPPPRYNHGFVAASSMDRNHSACREEAPHISADASRLLHTFGLSGFPKSLHLFSSVNCTHRTPKGFPPGIPGIGEEIET